MILEKEMLLDLFVKYFNYPKYQNKDDLYNVYLKQEDEYLNDKTIGKGKEYNEKM